jgi:3-dehydroquinate dehydratase-1
MVAVSLGDEHFEENLKRAKELGADAVEYRVDAFKNKDLNHCKRVIEYGNSLGLKAILTIRAPWEGGEGEVPNRVEYFRELTPLADFIDIELRAPEEEFEEVKKIVKCHDKKLIVSYHDFEKTPPQPAVEEIFKRMVAKGADVAKVAFRANSYEDVARLLCTAAKQPIPTVAIAMGEKGKISRVAGAVFNSIITYCALERAFAPGQLTLAEMRELLEKLY